MPTLSTSVHGYSSILFSIYGTLHVLHHFLAATIYDPDWHIDIQNDYMPRGVVTEKLMIMVPAFLSFASGWFLMYKNRTQLAKAIRETGQLALPFFGLGKKIFGDNFIINKNSKVSSSSSSEKILQLAKFRRVQYVSATLLGASLSAHLPAVMLLRYVMKQRDHAPINVYSATHALHDTKLPMFFRCVFGVYYSVLVSSFFVHGTCGFCWWRIKKISSRGVSVAERKKDDDEQQQQQQQQVDDDDDDHDKTSSSSTSTARRNTTISWYNDFVITPSIVVSTLVGFGTVIGLAMKTNLELCDPHFPQY